MNQTTAKLGISIINTHISAILVSSLNIITRLTLNPKPQPVVDSVAEDDPFC